MKKVVAAIFSIAAIALPQVAVALPIKVQGADVYQISRNGKKYIIVLAPGKLQITIHEQFAARTTPISPKSKPKTHTLNDCGFKVILVSSTFSNEFTFSYGSVAQAEENGYILNGPGSVPEAPALPLCRNVGIDKVPYVIQGWQP